MILHVIVLTPISVCDDLVGCGLLIRYHVMCSWLRWSLLPRLAKEVHLGAAVANLKKFQALRKFRVAGKAVLAINRLRTVSSDGGDTGAAIEAELVGGTTTAIVARGRGCLGG